MVFYFLFPKRLAAILSEFIHLPIATRGPLVARFIIKDRGS